MNDRDNFSRTRLVSVVIPAFNAAPYISDAIQSVANQDWHAIEIIVVDDGSDDETFRVAQSALSKIRGNQTFQLHRHTTNKGASEALNTGFSNAKGDFIAWLSADDLYVERSKITNQMHAIDTADFTWDENYYTGSYWSKETSRLVSAKWPPSMRTLKGVRTWQGEYAALGLLFANPINGSTILMTAKMYQSVGKFLSPYGNVDSDADYWMRAFTAGFKGIPTGQPAATFYRVHPAQTSSNTSSMEIGGAVCRLAGLRRYLKSPQMKPGVVLRVIRTSLIGGLFLGKPMASGLIYLELQEQKYVSIRALARIGTQILRLSGNKISKKCINEISVMATQHNIQVQLASSENSGKKIGEQKE